MKAIIQTGALLIVLSASGQVGVNTASPDALLEVKSLNEAAPAPTDGLIVPRVDAFPAVNPTASQQGMMLYLKTASGTNDPGFYYWDNSLTTWVSLGGKPDSDWFEQGSTTAPDLISDNAYRMGRVAVGTNIAQTKLDVLADPSVDSIAIRAVMSGAGNAEITGQLSRIDNSGIGHHFGYRSVLQGAGSGWQRNYDALIYSTGTGVQSGFYARLLGSAAGEQRGFVASIQNAGTGIKRGAIFHIESDDPAAQYGLVNRLSGSGTGNQWGVWNFMEGGGSGFHTGTFNQFVAGSGGQTGAWNEFSGTLGDGNLLGAYNSYFTGGNGILAGVYNEIRSSVNGSGLQYGAYTTNSSPGDGDHFGSYQRLAGTGNGQQFGTQNRLHNTGSGGHFGTDNLFSGDGTGAKTGLRNHFYSGSGAELNGVVNIVESSYDTSGVQTGMLTTNDSPGILSQFGTRTLLSGSGSGEKVGHFLVISSPGNGSHQGVQQRFSGTGSGNHTGVSNYFNNGSGGMTGVANQFITPLALGRVLGFYNTFYSSSGSLAAGTYTEFNALNPGSGTQFGNYLLNQSSGNGQHMGASYQLSGIGNGGQTGVRNIIDNSGNGVHYGTRQEMSGSGSGMHVGVYNNLSGEGSGQQFGILNQITNSGTSSRTAVYNSLEGASNAATYGVFTDLEGSGNGVMYGSYQRLTAMASGTAAKYGHASSMTATAGGTHFGVYSLATKAGSYAGYFLGAVYVSGTFTNPSDQMLKEKIEPTGRVTDKLMNVEVRDFNFKKAYADVYGFPTKRQTGFIAQQLQTVFPDLVTDDKLQLEGAAEALPSKGVNYLGLVPILTKALQEQQTEIEELRAKITAYEARLERLEKALGVSR